MAQITAGYYALSVYSICLNFQQKSGSVCL